ncbi:MAG: PH domain-containing protein [Gammaproteobacteria bacterium]|nr:PH domain-containing protein [Gammaproteobacteria bacterium]
MEDRTIIGQMQRFAPLGLTAAALVALLLAMAIRGTSAMWFLTLFAVLLPAAITAALIRWWPGGPEPGADINWQRNLTLAGAGLLLGAVLTLLLGVAWTGGRLGNMLLVAGAILLPPAALVAALGWLLGRESHIEDDLGEGEVIIHRAEEHWGVLLPPLLVLILAAALVIGPLGVVGFTAATVLYLLVLPGTGVAALAAYLNTRLAVTSDHLLIEQGLFRRRIRRLPLQRIDACGVKQGWFARLLGYGKVTFVLVDGSSLAVRGVKDPGALRARIRPAQGS